MKYWVVFILLIIGQGLFSACSSDSEFLGAPADVDHAEVYVSVTLAMNKGEATRASVQAPSTAPSLGMENGESYEDFILANDVRLLLFGQDDKFKEEVNILFKTDNTWMGALNSITQAELDAGTQFHIVALCNCKGTLATSVSLSNGLTLDGLIENITFSNYNSDFTKNLIGENANESRIPMWGICTTNFEKSGSITNVSINVLRSMAKVRVALGGEAVEKKFKLSGAKLNVANESGYLAAQNEQAYTRTDNVYKTNWNYVNSSDDFQNGIKYPSIPSGVNPVSEGLLFSEVTEDDGVKYYVIYIPEYNHFKDDNDGETVQETATIELMIEDEAGNSVTDSNGNNYKLHFADYSDGESPTAPEWDIIRNDIYDYTITKIESGLQVKLKVAPWAEYTHSGVVM